MIEIKLKWPFEEHLTHNLNRSLLVRLEIMIVKTSMPDIELIASRRCLRLQDLVISIRPLIDL